MHTLIIIYSFLHIYSQARTTCAKSHFCNTRTARTPGCRYGVEKEWLDIWQYICIREIYYLIRKGIWKCLSLALRNLLCFISTASEK